MGSGRQVLQILKLAHTQKKGPETGLGILAYLKGENTPCWHADTRQAASLFFFLIN